MSTDSEADGFPGKPGAGGVAVRPVSVADVADALALGCKDMWAAPLMSIAIAAVYTLGGWLLAACLAVLRLPYLVYPLAMGFALIAPFVAVAFYEVSRRLEAGERPSLSAVWCAVRAATRRDVRWMALITAFAFFIWMDIAAMLTLSFFGAAALDLSVLLTEILTTSQGIAFLIVGHLAGGVIAALVFSISVISFPLLHDRDIDAISAIITSVRLVRQSPVAMAAWCLTIAAAVVGAIASGLVLLPAVLPVLGYATWHLYRRAVA
ncbi:MAG: DUF2189 domain-containing protein [Hyphomicrobiaceae bacterium]|nr:DUF2189 domain-containing protein [Hyphomicrobiaceae bacterium]